jgi:hypothetical protein
VDREQGDRVIVRVHYRFTADLPSAALAVIDPDKLTWIEETTYDLEHATSTSRLLLTTIPTATASARTGSASLPAPPTPPCARSPET